MALSRVGIILAVFVAGTAGSPAGLEAAGASPTRCAEEEDTSGLLQSTQRVRRGAKGTSTGEEPAKILILTTSGGREPCCGTCGEDSHHHASLLGSETGGVRTATLAAEIKKGAEFACPDCQVDIVDLQDDCPSCEKVDAYDAVVVGAPTWSNLPSPDMVHYLGTWRPYSCMKCKVGAAFSTGSDIYGGIQPTIEVLHSYLMAYQFILVGNAAAGHAGEHLEGAADIGDLKDYTDIFHEHGRALGARVGNITNFVKGVPSVCGHNWPEPSGDVPSGA